ncbi:hypothetical protein IQ13_4198 [Lacibacter cauensis]|uniref:Uncharacterized protein n=2 Tax=Lacibacter cauensis TaxID=510947 RepID=A0A562SBB5_9BACT|nr:hypothetical protein IQ13_4198 [Lacibacter cauensis]
MPASCGIFFTLKNLIMASLIDKIVNASDEKVQERLQLLLATARGKLGEFELELQEMFRNPAAQENVQIIGNRAFEQYKIYSVNISQTPAGAIREVLDKFFQGTEEGVKSGILGLVEIGLNTVLGNRIAGEVEQSMFFIIPDKLNLIRVDVRVWRYNFTSTDIIDTVENAFCYIFTKSIIDHKKLSPDELIYFISRISGGNFDEALKLIDNLKILVEKLTELYKILQSMDTDIMQQKLLDEHPTWAQRMHSAATFKKQDAVAAAEAPKQEQ